MKYFDVSGEDALRALGSDAAKGLDSAQVAEARTRHGHNVLREKEKKTLLQRYLEQFKDVMVIILIVAAAVSFVLAFLGEEKTDYIESVVILAIVLLNATLGVVQENKAEKALDSLKKMTHAQTRVLRDGKIAVVDSEELVPGDIIRLEAGDIVPADARLLSTFSFRCDESSLTGESHPEDKDAGVVLPADIPLGDRANMIYSGCPVLYGRAEAVVCATGMETQIGAIAGLLDAEVDEKTPLQHKLAKIGKVFGFSAIGICAVIFVLGLIFKMAPLDIFMTSVSLAVAAIPEGMVAIVAVVLSMGVTRMVKRNAIVKTLPAVETLGSATVICSDKTGTLTQNKMTVVSLWTGNDILPADGGGFLEDKLALCGTLDCDASIDENGKEIGDPTEVAIVRVAAQRGFDKAQADAQYPRLAEIPFDSERKLMTTVHEMEGEKIVIVKGAFDVMKERCIAGPLEKATAVNEEMGSRALRVLAVGYKKIEQLPTEISPATLETELTLLGLLGMIDPPREEAKQAVAHCVTAGIRPIMITGDHVVTATAIGRELGILREGDRSISGAELQALDEDSFRQSVQEYSVYARVTPEDKIRIVKAWQSRGEVVAMTGDGVNDAPALKAADIGCAMGITGTEVAKGAADIILTDDNFATIVGAVKEGRGIFDNIKRIIEFLLGTNIGEVLTVLFAMLIWQHTPLLALQILWINLVTDALPAFALGFEPIHDRVMQRKPRPKQESFFAHGLGLRIVLQGVMFAVLTLAGFVIGLNVEGTASGGQTMAFLVLAVSQLIHAYNVRVDGSLLKEGFLGNKKMLLASAASLLLVLVIAFVPFLATVFGLVLLPVWLYAIALLLALLPLLFVELGKLVARNYVPGKLKGNA